MKMNKVCELHGNTLEERFDNDMKIVLVCVYCQLDEALATIERMNVVRVRDQEEISEQFNALKVQRDEARAELAKIHNAVEEQYAITHRISCERNHAERCHADTAVIAQERYIENERYKKALEHIRSMPWLSDKPYDLMDAVECAYAALEGDENE